MVCRDFAYRAALGFLAGLIALIVVLGVIALFTEPSGASEGVTVAPAPPPAVVERRSPAQVGRVPVVPMSVPGPPTPSTNGAS